MSAAWAAWFVGLPGSGKSAIARRVWEGLSRSQPQLVYLSMDERRGAYGPRDYSAEGRRAAYRAFVDEAAAEVAAGRSVLMDGTGHERAMRAYARRVIPRFAELSVRCSLETAMAREGSRPEGLARARLYRDALERRRTGKAFPELGEVIGVDVAFEEDPAAECIIDNEALSLEEAAERARSFIEAWAQSF